MQGAAIIEDLRSKAAEEAARITAAATAAIQSERQQAMTALRNEVGALATELAGKIVGEALDDQVRQSRIVDRFIQIWRRVSNHENIRGRQQNCCDNAAQIFS